MRRLIDTRIAKATASIKPALIFALPLIARPLKFSARPRSSRFARTASRAFGCAQPQHLSDPLKINSFPKNCGMVARHRTPRSSDRSVVEFVPPQAYIARL